MRRLIHASAALLAASLATGGTAQQADDAPRRAALSASVRFADLDGQSLARILPGDPFRVEVTLQSASGGLPRSIRPMAWIRPVALSDLPCTETAAAYRATGRGSAGAVDLNGLIFGVLTTDDALAILDPERNVGTANLIAAHRLGEPPAAMVADAKHGRFILTMPQAGQVIAIAPLSEPRVLARDIAAPGPIAATQSGAVWAIETETGDLLSIGDAGVITRLAIGATGIAAMSDRLAVSTRDAVLLLNPQGETLIRHATTARAATALSSPQGDALIWLDGRDLEISWTDASDLITRIPLSRNHDKISVSPDGRYAFAFGGGAEVSIADLSLSRVVQVVGSRSPVAEVAFLTNTAIMRTTDNTLAGIMDLRLIKPQAEPVVGQFNLGPPGNPDPDAALLVPLQPEEQILAVHAPGYTGFVLNATHGTSGKPPMEAIPLRGGIPHIVRALDQSLREEQPGRFATVTRLSQAAEYELVVSAGVGEASFCAPVPMDAPEVSPASLPGKITPETQNGGYRLRLSDGAGQPFAERQGHLLVTSLIGNWRGRLDFQTDADGLTKATYPFPHAPLAILVEAEGGVFDPLILE